MEDNNNNVQEPQAEVIYPEKGDQSAQLATTEQSQLVDACQQVFDSMVTRDYLHELCDCQVKPLTSTSNYSKVRWFKIDKIVMEKNVFFTDKLSMLYMSLHKTAKNVILVLNKQNEGDIELYLGARDFSGNSGISGEILEAGLEGYFPGIGFKPSSIPDLTFTSPSVSSVSAIASLRDDKKEDFVQGIERLINATSAIPQFRAYFVADSVGNAETSDMIYAFNNLYSSLSPAETLQMTFNESETKGVSESFSENFSESIGESISQTVTHTDGYSDTTTKTKTKSSGTSENYSRNIFVSILNGIKGGKTGSGKNSSRSNSRSRAIGKNFSDSEANQKGTNKNVTNGTTKQNGQHNDKTKGFSKQITYKNRTAKFYLDILDKQLERLQNGRPFGLWSVATYFIANDSTTAQQLSNIYRGSIIGEESGLETCAINTWTDESQVKEISHYLVNSLNPRFDYNSLNVSAGSVVNSKELAIHLSLPQSSVPGIIVEERASFARNIYDSSNNANDISLGTITHLGKLSQTPVCLCTAELTKHTFVTGSTGSGKSNAMYSILKQLRDNGKTFMVIEPAKGEYKHVFGCLDDVTIYSNTNKVGELLKVNPFVFPYEYIDVIEHIDFLVDIFNACWPMYAAMPAVLKHSIITAYEKCGWDVDSSTHELANPIFPQIEDIIVCLKEYLDHSDYSAETKSDYKGALEVRLQDLCDGMFGKMLNGNGIPDDILFNHNSIIDLSRIGSVETKSLIMGFIVMKLKEFRMSEGGMNEDLKHVTVLEEAHNLLKKTSTSQSQESSNLAGKSVEMISNSIAEIRTYGEGFIIVDQSPALLDSSAIRNTNTKIILALPDIEDRKAAGASMSLSDEQIEEISRQKQGEAIVYQNIWEEPVQCKISKFEEFEPNFRYSKQTEPAKKRNREYSLKVIYFLLYPYLKKEINLAEIKTIIEKQSMPASVRFTLLQMIEEYCSTGSVSLWEEYNFVELAFVVKLYLNLDSVYSNLTQQLSDMKQVRVKLDKILAERLSCEIDTYTLYYTELCYVRNNALYNDWRNTFK